MRIGITGGAGFIGGHVAEAAVERGHEVVIFDRTGKLVDPIGRLMEEKTGAIFLGDVRDATAMAELAAHVDGIIHLAACLGTQETIQNPVPAADTNVFGGLNFLEACAQYDIPGVYIGVGNHWMENTYSISKTTVERFVRMFNKERGTRVNIVRLVNAYGPRQSVAPPFGPAKVRKITPAFVCRALTGQPLEIYGDGEQVSDMVYVRDGARALVIGLENAAEGNVWPEPVEVGPAVSKTVNQVAANIIDAAKMLGYQPVEELVHLPMRPGEIPGARVTADVATLAMAGMHWSDLTGLDEGILDTVKWYADNWLPGYLEHVALVAAGFTPVVPELAPTQNGHAPHPGMEHEGPCDHRPDFPSERAQSILATKLTSPRQISDEELADLGVAAHTCGPDCNPGNCPVKDF